MGNESKESGQLVMGAKMEHRDASMGYNDGDVRSSPVVSILGLGTEC